MPPAAADSFMKKKSKITHEQLVAEGVVWVPRVDDPITPKPTADVVAPISRKTNAAPRITDTPRKMPPGVTGLQRSINANILAQGGKVPSSEPKTDSVTGLQRAINANIAAQKKS
jgi:hypothetical protein